jgi:hypothetical protein
MSNITVKEAMECLSENLRNDPSYRETWIANIAMPILDDQKGNIELRKEFNLHGPCDLTTHEGVNRMAKILLSHFFGPFEAGYI